MHGGNKVRDVLLTRATPFIIIVNCIIGQKKYEHHLFPLLTLL